MENTTAFLIKQLSLRLEEDEWVSLLEHYGRNANWEASPNSFLSSWAEKREIPKKAVEWINENVGSHVWTQKDEKGKSPFSTLCQPYNLQSTSDEALVALVNTVPLSTYIETLEETLEKLSDQRGGAVYMQQPLNHWKGIFAVIAACMQAQVPQVATALIREHPHLLDARQDGYTTGALLGASGAGWKEYLKAGGSIFQQVHIDPATNSPSQENGQPLWLWFLKKKIYHQDFKSTLDQLMLRLMEGREPSEGDYIVSDDDWQKLVENKGLILGELRMIEFEKKIGEDWKVAIKENKKWRQWRSSEGANFMLWLCAKNPPEFIRQAYKTKINLPLIQTKDGLGRDFFQYLLTGCLVGDFGTWRRTEKIKDQLYPEMLAAMKPHIDKNPPKGLFADWCMAANDAYFGALKRAQHISGAYHYEYLKPVLRENEGLFWNGIDYDALRQIFHNPVISTRLNKMVPALISAYSHQQIKDQYDKMDEKTKLAFVIFTFSSQVDNSLNNQTTTWRNEEAERLMSYFPEGITASEVAMMAEWLDKHQSRIRPDTIVAIAASLQRHNISLSLKEKEDETGEKPVAKAVKRRM